MSFLFELFLFIFALVWFIYLPAEGVFSLAQVGYAGWKRLTLGLSTGIVLIIFLTYSLATIALRDFVPLILSGFSVLALFRWPGWSRLFKAGWEAPHVLLLFFSVLFSISVVTSGWVLSDGMVMRSVNAQDGIWNIALAQELKESFPPQHPSIAGLPLKGYHIFYNLWLAQISRMIPITLTHLHYHFAAGLLALLFVYGIYALCQRLSNNKNYALWGTFIAVFGGSFSFIVPVIYHRLLSFDDAFGITQPFSLLLSPSVVLSIIVLVWMLLLLTDFIKKKSVLLGILVALFAGVSVGIKVYAGVIAMGVLAIISGYYVVFKRQWLILLITVIGGALSAFVFFPLNASYGFLILEVLWPPHRLMEGTLNFTNWALKRQTLAAMGSKKGLFKLEVQAMAYFLLGNIGTRVIGFLGFFPIPRTLSALTWMLIITLGISFTVPMLFIQPIGAYNMIQFFWYFMVFIGIICGIGIGKVLYKLPKTIAITVGLVIILFTLPSAGWRLYYLFKDTRVPVTRDQWNLYKQFESVGSYSDAVIELPSLSSYSAKELQNWSQYVSLPYLPAFARKRVLFGNEVVQFRYDELWKDRLSLLETFMVPQKNPKWVEVKIKAYTTMKILYNKYHVRYILTQSQPVWFDGDSHFRRILHNPYGTVYRIFP